MTEVCIRKGHFTMCPVHPTSRITRGKECVKCHNAAVMAEKKAREANEKAKEAEKKSKKDDDDFFKRAGKDRKPRSEWDRSSGDGSSGAGAVQW